MLLRLAIKWQHSCLIFVVLMQEWYWSSVAAESIYHIMSQLRCYYGRSHLFTTKIAQLRCCAAGTPYWQEIEAQPIYTGMVVFPVFSTYLCWWVFFKIPQIPEIPHRGQRDAETSLA